MADESGRREALKRLGLMLGAVGMGGGVLTLPMQKARSAEMAHLSTDDVTAKALAYTENAATVDAAQNPSYRSGQKCSTCEQLQGKSGQAWRPCNLFADKLVSSNGWCRAWTTRTAAD